MVLQSASDDLAAPAYHAPPHRERLYRARCLIDTVALYGAKRSPGKRGRSARHAIAGGWPGSGLAPSDRISRRSGQQTRYGAGGAALERVRRRSRRSTSGGRTSSSRRSIASCGRPHAAPVGPVEPSGAAWHRRRRRAARAVGELMHHLIAAGDPVPRAMDRVPRAHLEQSAARRERPFPWLARLAPGQMVRRWSMPEQDAIYLKGFLGAGVVRRSAVPGPGRPGESVPEEGARRRPVARGPTRASACCRGPADLAQLGACASGEVRGRPPVDRQGAGRGGGAPRPHPAGARGDRGPDFGLDAPGTLRRLSPMDRGDTHHRQPRGDAVVADADGVRKSVPAAVRQTRVHDAELKKTVKTIASVLPAQKARLERLLLSDRSCLSADWCTRYVDHPLVGEMARRLIWRFSEGDDVALGAIDGGRVVGAHDQPIPWLTAADERALLASARRRRRRRSRPGGRGSNGTGHAAVQAGAPRGLRPHRRRARARGTYSNRFAAHILAPASVRGAVPGSAAGAISSRARWDSAQHADAPTAAVERSPVEFWVETVDDPRRAGALGHLRLRLDRPGRASCATGRAAAAGPRSPPLVFSEVMRDVDLFVGVAQPRQRPDLGRPRRRALSRPTGRASPSAT